MTNEDLPSAPLQAWMTAVLACVVGQQSAVYVSTPITTGERFVTWKRGLAAAVRTGDDEYSKGLLEHVVTPNRAQVAGLVERLRSTSDSPVIDPTALEDVPGWQQLDYHGFWTEVIRRYAHTVVFAEGWHYSSGCVLELATAAEAGVALLRQDPEPLTSAKARDLVRLAITDISTDDVLSQEPLQQALRVLETRQEQGATKPRGAFK